jgi:hypothetical protein
MRFLPVVLLVLALPAGLLGYVLGAQLMTALALPDQVRGILVLFVPLFAAGLFMLPFVVPFFDRKAKQDLAAHLRSQEALPKGRDRRGKRR